MKNSYFLNIWCQGIPEEIKDTSFKNLIVCEFSLISLFNRDFGLKSNLHLLIKNAAWIQFLLTSYIKKMW